MKSDGNWNLLNNMFLYKCLDLRSVTICLSPEVLRRGAVNMMDVSVTDTTRSHILLYMYSNELFYKKQNNTIYRHMYLQCSK